jgi:hypothetical protein
MLASSVRAEDEYGSGIRADPLQSDACTSDRLTRGRVDDSTCQHLCPRECRCAEREKDYEATERSHDLNEKVSVDCMPAPNVAAVPYRTRNGNAECDRAGCLGTEASGSVVRHSLHLPVNVDASVVNCSGEDPLTTRWPGRRATNHRRAA